MLKNILKIAICVTAVAGTGVLAIMINIKKKIDKLKSLPITLPDNFTYTAHTGCMGTDANSLEAIAAGVSNGAEIVEFDLNFNKYGEPVLSHDSPKGNEVTLDEAFKKVSEYENLKVNVDVKSVDYLEKVKPLAEKYGIADRIFFTGIFAQTVDSAKATGIPYYLNVEVEPERKHTEEYLLSLVELVKSKGAIGVNFNKNNASKALVDVFHENGLLVSIWTVDKEKDIYKILSYAPDNITTKYPDKLSEAVKSD